MPSLQPLIVDSPLAFGIDQGTGLLTVVATGTVRRQVNQTIDVPAFPMSVILFLTPETAQQLLASLPALETLLVQATERPAKPRSVQ